MSEQQSPLMTVAEVARFNHLQPHANLQKLRCEGKIPGGRFHLGEKRIAFVREEVVALV